MNYGGLVGDTLRVVWRNKFLWFFGFFAGGTAANIGGNIPSGGGGFDGDDFDRIGSVPVSLAQVGQGGFENVALVAAIVALVLLVGLVFVVMALISQGALAESVAAVEQGEEHRFGSAFRAGLSNFWRVLGYYVLFILIALGFLLLIGVPIALLVFGVFAATESVGARVSVGILAALAAIALLIAVFVPLFIVAQYALRGIVVGRERVMAAVGSGYRLFRRNLGASLLVWLLQVALMIGIGITFLIALLLVGLLLFAPAIVLGLAGYATAAVVAAVIAGVVLLPILLATSGAFGAFNHSYWTLAYLRLVSPNEGQIAGPEIRRA